MSNVVKLKNHQRAFTTRALNKFLEETFELAFGDGAIDKYHMFEVVEKLKEFSDKAQHYDELVEESGCKSTPNA